MHRYTVRCQFITEDPSVTRKWLAWLRQAHLSDVLDAGAICAEIVEMSDPQTTYEIRYQFASQKDFQAYLRDHADGLRAKGLKAFPLDLGLIYSRTDGVVIYQI